MAQNNNKNNDKDDNKTPRALFHARTRRAPYRPDAADFAWIAQMNAGDDRARAEGAFTAAAEGNTWRLKFLLDRGLPVDCEGQESEELANMSLLHIAVEKSRHDAARLLLERGADANLPDECVGLPLVKAVKKGDVQMVCLLLHYNADPDATDDFDDCARDLAQMNPVIKSIMEETALPRRKGGGGPSF